MKRFFNLFSRQKGHEALGETSKQSDDTLESSQEQPRRISPDNIRTLGRNEIFVFGSNVHGFHGGGAAAAAMRQFGAIWGQGEGLQGQSYAIPTMEGIENLSAAVSRFTEFAEKHPELRFLVTRIGCGIAGYSVEEIAPLFEGCIELGNVALPTDFFKILRKK